jgi:hypothetical protein
MWGGIEIIVAGGANLQACLFVTMKSETEPNVELIDFLDALCLGAGKDAAMLESACANLARPENLEPLLQSVKGTETLLRDSYQHANGFHKLVLLKGTHFKLRLHHFGAVDDVPVENIHDHRWPFASTIIHGKLYMDTWEEVAQADEAAQPEEPQPEAQADDAEGGQEIGYRFIYHSAKGDGHFNVQFEGPAVLRRIRVLEFSPTQTYTMNMDQMHRITNRKGQECVTLMLTGIGANETCSLYARSPVISVKQRTTVPYEPLKINEILDTIIRRIV